MSYIQPKNKLQKLVKWIYLIIFQIQKIEKFIFKFNSNFIYIIVIVFQ